MPVGCMGLTCKAQPYYRQYGSGPNLTEAGTIWVAFTSQATRTPTQAPCTDWGACGSPSLPTAPQIQLLFYLSSPPAPGLLRTRSLAMLHSGHGS